MTKEERAKARLEQLHRSFKEDTAPATEWVFVYNRNPKHSRPVHVWLKRNGSDEFGVTARYAGESWVNMSGKLIDSVVAWRDL